MAHILPDPEAGELTPSGDGSTDPNAGWECPRCHYVWAPSVLACHNCPQPPSFIAKESDPGPVGIGGCP